MRKLGLSIYPEKSTKEEIMTYLKKASEYGFTRIFSCLLSVEKSPVEIKAEFLEMNRFAKALGYEVIVDVSPRVFKELGISYQDLTAETVSEAASEYSPALIANYCYDLAREYNQFYHEYAILGEAETSQRDFRLVLSRLTSEVLSTGMWLLGIEMPERM